MSEGGRKKTACVTGRNGYIASVLIKMLLQKGYAVKTTVRNPGTCRLQALGPLQVLRADLDDEGSFDDAVAGWDYAFLVAAPVNLHSKNPEKELIEPAVRGTLNVMRSCAKAGTVKRVVLTSLAAAVSGRPLQGSGHVLDEESWSDVEYLTANKSGPWGYPVSKVLSEKETMSWFPNAKLAGDEAAFGVLRGIEMATGCVPLVHVADLCRAEMFVAEEDAAAGSCSDEVLQKPRVSLSSAKLVSEGFEFKYQTLGEIYDDVVEHGKALGILPS
ncbi:unnamed protein product [Miscanthus lutarioriparius]|uniref:NAD-dependent epimerase/dehydratase domain-containing protein n=1 Tax=Miscanthus lutarioriparius TaxID=422564 RepID=A0A811QRL4_9POAL|nr:unnamed protein product [Miscanthus lutarioriparius]